MYRLVQKKGPVLLSTSQAQRGRTFSQLSDLSFARPCTGSVCQDCGDENNASKDWSACKQARGRGSRPSRPSKQALSERSTFKVVICLQFRPRSGERAIRTPPPPPPPPPPLRPVGLQRFGLENHYSFTAPIGCCDIGEGRQKLA